MRLNEKKAQTIVEYVLLLAIFVALMMSASQAVLDGFGVAFNKFAAALSRPIDY